MPVHKKNAQKIIMIFQVVFYLLFVITWFKDSFPLLEKIPLSPSVALVFLVILTLLRLALKARVKKFGISPSLRRDILALTLIILAATVVRLPYLSHNYGLMDSDEAIPVLMGKHISEGKLPPLFYYGAFFQGSFPQHCHALMFWLFGYSVFMAKFSAFLAFAAFLCVHFFLMKRIFSFGFACLMGLFTCLPLPHLIISSFDIGSGFPTVFLFGSLIFYLTYSIVFQNKDKWVPALGFLMGLAFWTHQISFIFILTVSFFLLSRFKARLKNYFRLLIFFGLGSFPVLMNEVFRGFVLVRFLLPGGSGSLGPEKLTGFRDMTIALISSGPVSLGYLYLALIVAGAFVPVVFSLQKRKIHPSLLFTVYFICFSAVYILSDFSGTNVIRYLYILYLVLPVLLGSVFLFLKTRVRYPVMAVFFLLVFILSNWDGSRIHAADIKTKHVDLNKVLTAIEETGERYWISEYWTSYLLTAISKENLIVASHTVRRYYPYNLFYYSGNNNNWIFSRDAPDHDLLEASLLHLLEALEVGHEKQDTGKYSLVYRIQNDIFPRFILAYPPELLPDVNLKKITTSGGLLDLVFVNRNAAPTGGIRLYLDIPGYSSRFFPLPQEEEFSFRIPFPDEKSFKIKHYVAYAGIVIGSTLKEAECTLSDEDLRQHRRAIEFLKGIGPQREVEGKRMHVLQKETAIEFNPDFSGASKIAFQLHSPFQFSHPFWYGDHCQEVSVYINDHHLMDQKLQDDRNVVLIHAVSPPFRKGRNIINLKFKYALVVSYSELWKTAAYLERIAME